MTGGTTTPDARPAGDDALSIRVLRGSATAEELAALIAVVSESYAREAAAAVADDESRQAAWAVSQRALRAPMSRDLGWTRSHG